MTASAVYRFDRHGRRQFVTSPETQKALAVLNAAISRGEREEREAMKARQNAGKTTTQERMMCSIFGEIK